MNAQLQKGSLWRDSNNKLYSIFKLPVSDDETEMLGIKKRLRNGEWSSLWMPVYRFRQQFKPADDLKDAA